MTGRKLRRHTEKTIKKTAVCARQIQWPGAGSNRRPSDFQDYGNVFMLDRHRPWPGLKTLRGNRRTKANETEIEKAWGCLVQLTSTRCAACLPDIRDHFMAYARQGRQEHSLDAVVEVTLPVRSRGWGSTKRRVASLSVRTRRSRGSLVFRPPRSCPWLSCPAPRGSRRGSRFGWGDSARPTQARWDR